MVRRRASPYNASMISQTSVCTFAYTHSDDVIMGMIASQITSLTVVYSIVYSDVDQRKHQSSASLAFVRGIHRRPVNFPHKWPVTRKMFPFDDVIMYMWACGQVCVFVEVPCLYFSSLIFDLYYFHWWKSYDLWSNELLDKSYAFYQWNF